MVMTNDTKFTWNNVGPTNFKNSSKSLASSITSSTGTPTVNAQLSSSNKRVASLADEEIIQKNLKELMDKKHQEERKANGRLVAVVLASLVIFLAIYHAWIRNSGLLAGIFVPAIIMVSFGAWVVVLAKRDKAKRQVFEKYLQEVALKNKQELEAKSKTKKSKDKKVLNNILLHYENEIDIEQMPLAHLSDNSSITKTTSILKSKDHRNKHKHRYATTSDGYSTTSSSSSLKKASHYATKDLRVKRPSIRQKLFRQTGIHRFPAPSPNVTHTLVQAVINTPPLVVGIPVQSSTNLSLLEAKRNRLQRLDSIEVPSVGLMSSVP